MSTPAGVILGAVIGMVIFIIGFYIYVGIVY